MANWVAFSWEHDRLLFLSASLSGKTVTYEHVAVLDDPQKLAGLIAEHRLAKADAVVVLNRSDVELRPMVFPPVPADELPDLVKFQAGREFNNYDPSAPVDFFVTSRLEDVTRSTLFPAIKPSDLNAQASGTVADGAPKHILASTLRLATFQQIKSFCEKNGLVLRHIVLRPCATASLFQRSGMALAEGATLLVELDKFETSLTVVLQGEPVFMRSPKISRPQDVSVPDFAARILAELKRTCIAARNEIQGIDVDEIVLCGSSAMFELLAEQLKKGIEMPVRLFDPLKGLTVKTPDADERHTSLFGVIGQVARREPIQIDFCNPKKKAENTNVRNWMTGIAAAVLVLLVCLFGYVFYSQTTLRQELGILTVQFNDLAKTSSTVVNQNRQIDEIEKWKSSQVNWFERLAWLSQNALSAQDMMIRDLRFETTPTPGMLGNISFIALLRRQEMNEDSLMSAMTDRFRDNRHVPQTGQIGQESGNPQRYVSRINMTIRLVAP